jgi:hypothetical protein
MSRVHFTLVPVSLCALLPYFFSICSIYLLIHLLEYMQMYLLLVCIDLFVSSEQPVTPSYIPCCNNQYILNLTHHVLDTFAMFLSNLNLQNAIHLYDLWTTL